MNSNNKNLIYGPIPFLEETIKNYQENVDYKVIYINNLKHYEIVSEKLKKYLEEEWHQKINPNTWGGLCPLSEEILKQNFSEGVDYSIEMFNGAREVKVRSERLKKAWQNWREEQDKKQGRNYGDEIADAFLNLVTNGKVKSWNDPGKGRWKNTAEQRQEVIAENNPPQFYNVGIKREKYAEWIKQQPPLTSAELKALNDPILGGVGKGDFSGLEELNCALWWIQKVRQANAEIFLDKHFAWHEGFEKELDNPQSNDYKAIQVLKKAGISLDKLFERVEKGRQAKVGSQDKKRQKYKEKILANLDDWTLFTGGIFNAKNHTAIECRGNSIIRINVPIEGDKLTKPEELPDLETYQEIHQAIFNNILKNIRENKNELEVKENSLHLKKADKQMNYEREKFSSSEWAEIEKELKKYSSIPSKNQSANDNSSRHNNLIIFFVVVLITVTTIGILLIMKKKSKKKHGPKR